MNTISNFENIADSYQSQTMPDVNSIDIQTEIQWFMRPYLLDFLVEAHAAFQLLPETLFLAVNLLDRYCSRRVVYKRHYQLVGCAALLIAAKYGDKKDRVPTVRELKSMCCSLYDDEMFTQMEWHVLQTLNWIVGHTTVDAFLQIALSESPYDAEVEHMTLYIAEISLFHKEFVSTRPSVLARSALALICTSHPLFYPASMPHYSCQMCPPPLTNSYNDKPRLRDAEPRHQRHHPQLLWRSPDPHQTCTVPRRRRRTHMPPQ
jgi:hypothetical protein